MNCKTISETEGHVVRVCEGVDFHTNIRIKQRTFNIVKYLILEGTVSFYINGEWIKDKFDLKGHVFRWWFLFPVSMITWFFGSVLKDVYDLIYSKLGGLYEKVLNL
jgi:hypothetical protein